MHGLGGFPADWATKQPTFRHVIRDTKAVPLPGFAFLLLLLNRNSLVRLNVLLIRCCDRQLPVIRRFGYFLRNGKEGWRSLGGVLLCVTGCEALFADLGHFSRKSIQASFIGLCWPCLLLTYLGQASAPVDVCYIPMRVCRLTQGTWETQWDA